MKNNDWLVFVEVKLKIGLQFGNPEEMINKNKINQVKRVAEGFLLLESPIAKKFNKYRIDAVCIVLKSTIVFKYVIGIEYLVHNASSDKLLFINRSGKSDSILCNIVVIYTPVLSEDL